MFSRKTHNLPNKNSAESNSMPSDKASQKRLVIHAFLAGCVTLAIVVFYPMGRPVDETVGLSFIASYGWVFSQTIAVTSVPLLLSMLAASWAPRLALWSGSILIALVPVISLLDCICFHWVGERLLSSTTLHIFSSLLPGLLPFLGWGSITAACLVVIVGTLIAWASIRIGKFGSDRWSVEQPRDLSPIAVFAATVILAGLLSIPAWMSFATVRAKMASHSIRHPACIFRWLPYRNVGIRHLGERLEYQAQLAGLSLAGRAEGRLKGFRHLDLEKHPAGKPDAQTLPDVVLFVLESWRHETVEPKNMPALVSLMQSGRYLPHHFSGGNSTNIGMFSALNGLESIWFYRSHEFSPLLPRLMKQAGYETGFFGGADDWEEFDMEGFITAKHYDRFVIEPMNWLETDRRSVQAAAEFLEPSKSTPPSRPPRLAIVYLYSSHKQNDTIKELEIFQPAVSGRQYVMPYTEAMQPAIWNRYRNSLRSLDHVMSELLNPHRVIIAVGDHGESYLDDGTIGHGSRMSAVQCMTPAMFYFPNKQLPAISAPTYHADLLPTLLSGLGLAPSDSKSLDGVDLFTTDSNTLDQRILGVTHYLASEMLLVGPWTLDAKQPFGYRVAASVKKWRLARMAQSFV